MISKKSKFIFFSISTVSIFLLGCTKSPAEQCLESFRYDLISPNSAKVVKIEGEKLTYLAKNRNGVEIQGKAICNKMGMNGKEILLQSIWRF